MKRTQIKKKKIHKLEDKNRKNIAPALKKPDLDWSIQKRSRDRNLFILLKIIEKKLNKSYFVRLTFSTITNKHSLLVSFWREKSDSFESMIDSEFYLKRFTTIKKTIIKPKRIISMISFFLRIMNYFKNILRFKN